MTLPQSIRTAAANDYSELSVHVKEMSAKIDWGISFEKALEDFAKKVPSNFLNKKAELLYSTSFSNEFQLLACDGQDLCSRNLLKSYETLFQLFLDNLDTISTALFPC